MFLDRCLFRGLGGGGYSGQTGGVSETSRVFGVSETNSVGIPYYLLKREKSVLLQCKNLIPYRRHSKTPFNV